MIYITLYVIYGNMTLDIGLYTECHILDFCMSRNLTRWLVYFWDVHLMCVGFLWSQAEMETEGGSILCVFYATPFSFYLILFSSLLSLSDWVNLCICSSFCFGVLAVFMRVCMDLSESVWAFKQRHSSSVNKDWYYPINLSLPWLYSSYLTNLSVCTPKNDFLNQCLCLILL